MRKANGVHTTKVLTVAEWRPPEPRTPAEVAELKRMRRKMIKAVDRLMAFLDSIEGDPDIEDHDELDEGDGDTDDEPSLGSLDRMMDQRRWSEGANGDLEQEHDGREPDDEGDELDTLESDGLGDEGSDEDFGESDGLDSSEGPSARRKPS